MQLKGYDAGLARALAEELNSARDPAGTAIQAAVAIGGKIAASVAVGVCGDGVTPVTADDLFDIGSISKVYCAAAVCRLESLGKLKLDDPVRDYLTWFRTRDPRDKDITFRMLLDHSSGLPGTNSRNMITAGKGTSLRAASNRRYWSRAKLKAAPGEYATYCNEGFELAAAAVEEISGMEYMDFLKKEILLPLGLKSHRLADTLSGREHPVYIRGEAEEIIVAKGAGAISCTIEDNALFGAAFLRPGVLSEREIAEMIRPFGKTKLFRDEMGANYGLGWDGVEITEYGLDLGAHALRKGGATKQFTSYLVVIPKLDMSISLSATCDNGFFAGHEIYRLIEIAAVHLGFDIRKRETAGSAEPPADPAADLAEYCGIYYGPGAIFRMSIEGGEFLCEAGDGLEWQTFFKLPFSAWDGECLRNGEERIYFEESGGNTYFLTSDYCVGVPVSAMAQKIKGFGELPEGWRKRVGKRYVAADLSPLDLELDGPCSATVIDLGDGVINIALQGAMSGIVSARPAGDDDSEMFIDCPGSGSSNLWAPYFYTENGREILAIDDYDLVEESEASDTPV